MAILDDYFEELSSPTKNGRVDINGDCMEDSQIFPGEIVVFLHGGRLVKMARASSSVIASDNDLPRHFTIDAESIRIPRRMLRISEFQEILFKVAGLATNLASKNWNHLQDSDVLISIIDRL
ncbi:MAG: hypothetical protein NZ736_01605 [Candidatus Poseidoniaceae archaeon]|nr:hypothetical protein [Candidatus Poseidoniaceae archaeon]